MAKVEWPDQATNDLDEIAAYIRELNPGVAEKIGAKLFALGESLAYALHHGRPAARGTRELVSVQPYVLRYRVLNDVVTIISIRHSARRSLQA